MPKLLPPTGRSGSLSAQRRNAVRSASLLLCLAFASACNTTSDAKAVATQLSDTATALTSYYTALHTEIVNTDQLNNLEQGINGLPYDTQTRAKIMDTAAEIQKRADIANNISTLAASLTQLTTSTGATDASTAAGKLASAAASIKPLAPFLTAPVQAGMTAAAQEIAAAIQQRKIREAARQVSVFLDNFNKLFAAEEPACETINDQYVDLAATLSGWFVANGQTDPAAYSGALSKMALTPYGLTAKVDAPTVAKIAATAQMFINQKSTDMKAAHTAAGKAMEDALADIAVRAADVAANKPLPAGIPPPTLTTINQWTATIAAK
ncbi:MAG: hypothetical protein P4K94_07335 [Terracidiphilus sp.]|nr:hypothetical protein [Terracidiphilus sp.]